MYNKLVKRFDLSWHLFSLRTKAASLNQLAYQSVKFRVVMRHRLLVLLALFVVAFGSYGLDTSSDLQLPKDHYLLAISGDRRLWFKKGVVTVEELERNLVGMRRVGRPITLVVALDARIDKNGLFYLDLQRMLSSVDSKIRLIDMDTFRSNLTSKSSG